MSRSAFEKALGKQKRSLEVNAASKALTVAAVAALEKRLGVDFPAQYVDFLRRYGALRVRAKAGAFPAVPSTSHQVTEAWRLQNEFRVLGSGGSLKDKTLEIERGHRALHKRIKAEADPEIRRDLVPFLLRAGVDGWYCFDPRGRIYEWEHLYAKPRLEKGAFYGLLTECAEWLVESIELAAEHLRERHPVTQAPTKTEWEQKLSARVQGWSASRRVLELELAISEGRPRDAAVLLDAGVRLSDYGEAFSFNTGQNRSELIALLERQGVSLKLPPDAEMEDEW